MKNNLFPGTCFPKEAEELIEKFFPAPAVTQLAANNEAVFMQDFFAPDGWPADPEVNIGDVFTPLTAVLKLGTQFPAEIHAADPLLRQKYCLAGMDLLLSMVNSTDKPSFNALAFQKEFDGKVYTFAFPDTHYSSYVYNQEPTALLLIADSYYNDEKWDKQASVPPYAWQMAMLQLWCWEQWAEKSSDFAGERISPPTACTIVRTVGNLPSDCIIRTVNYDRKKAEDLVRRVLRSANGAKKENIQPRQSWAEKVEEDGTVVCGKALYDLTKSYMVQHQERKVLEAELKAIESEMDAIAVQLASHMTAAKSGTLELADGSVCTVTHNPKRSVLKQTVTQIQAIESLFPDLAKFIDRENGGSIRRTVTISDL